MQNNDLSAGDFASNYLAMKWKYIAGQLIMPCSSPIQPDLIERDPVLRMNQYLVFLGIFVIACDNSIPYWFQQVQYFPTMQMPWLQDLDDYLQLTFAWW